MTTTIIFNFFTFLLAAAGGFLILGTWTIWSGMYRDELLYVSLGFITLSLGFLWNVVGLFGFPTVNPEILSMVGMSMLFLGSARILTYSTTQ